MVELTQEQRDLLDVIMNDKYANGAFCGMVFNQVAQKADWSDEAILIHIQLALNVRLLANEWSK